MNLNRSFLIIIILVIISCQKINETEDLSKIVLSRNMNLNQVIDSVGMQPNAINDCDDTHGTKGWKLQVVFWDDKGRLDVYFNKDLNLEYYSYDD